MTEINLREYYPDYYRTDYRIIVPDEVAEIMLEYKRYEEAYRRRTYYHKAYYSLDCNDGMEYEALFLSASPEEVYEQKVAMEQILIAMGKIPEKQARRIYAYYFLDMTMEMIAEGEGVSSAAVGESIRRGLLNMEIFLRKFL